MPNKLKVILFLLSLFALAVSCSQEKQESANNEIRSEWTVNPNGDSELALFMRAMFDEAAQVRKQIANQEPIKLSLEHEKILTAHATEPEKAASPAYKAFAEAYMQNMKNIQTARPKQVAELYDNMVEGCMSCHKAMCPGPMVKIKKLRRPDVDM